MSHSLTPLDPWVESLLGVPVTARAIQAHQMGALARTLDRAMANSPFYRDHLAGMAPPSSLDDLAAFPLLTQENLRNHGDAMLCVSRDDVARVMTLQSSGTTGPPKRVWFTRNDLEWTMEFFHHGMVSLVSPGQKVLILLPGSTPDSTGDLLVRALARMNVAGIVHGLATDPAAALAEAHEHQVDCLVGFPVQLLAMARLDSMGKKRLNPRSVLLCSDYAPASVIQYLERVWNCTALVHWGSTESGLGGGVECWAQSGSHLRQADLIMEIIDPVTLESLPGGHWGEMVITTPKREAMPLIRYRTGDLGRLLPGTCPCGSALARLDRVQGRLDQSHGLKNGRELRLSHLDEALFGLEPVMDYAARLLPGGSADRLGILLAAAPGTEKELAGMVLEQLRSLSRLGDTDQGPGPVLEIEVKAWRGKLFFPGKRTLTDERVR